MILGQRLNPVNNNLLGQKIIHKSMRLGQRIAAGAQKVKALSDNVNDAKNEARKIYSNLEKINARKRLQ